MDAPDTRGGAGGAEPIRHPYESDEYRRARQELLVEEIELRRHEERVAELRRPPEGGEVPREYHFVAEDGSDATLAELFGEHDTLIVYSYMFGPERDAPCPMCTSLMGGLDHKIADILVSVLPSPSPPARRSSASSRPRRHEAGVSCPCSATGSGDYTRDDVRPRTPTWPATTCSREMVSSGTSAATRSPVTWPIRPGSRRRSRMDPLWLLLDTTPEGAGDRLASQLTY